MNRTPARPAWSRHDLWHLGAASSTFVALAFTGFIAFVASCNVHELGHVVVALPLGWEVERVHLCLPGGGGVEYSSIGHWAGNAQGYAGGLIAAGVLAVLYAWLFERRGAPLRSPRWWAAGVGVVLPVGPQLVVAFVEGTAQPGENYTDRFADTPALMVLVVASMIGVAGLYVWRWRAVWAPPEWTDEDP